MADHKASPTGSTSNLLRQNFINIRRVREWRDIHSQLLTVLSPSTNGCINDRRPPATSSCTCRCSAGLLGNIGCKLDDEEVVPRCTRHQVLQVTPALKLSKKPGRWIVAAELVETTRLFGRGIANIEPQWIEQVAAIC